MCGICGFVGKGAKETDRMAVLEEMMDAIRHRGPDDGGSYQKAEAAFGFRRLAIIDLEKGAQPMKNETGDLVLIFNGEIYNYRELREKLKEAGHIFGTQSDTEVLLHGYEEWGEKLLPKLRGMFAFAIWDEKKKEIFAARDFFGVKPFYYTMIGETLVFASEIKSILKYPAYEKKLNEEALEQYLSFQYSALDETFFKGIFRLQPGHCLRYRPGSIVLEIHRYFSPELTPKEWKSEEILTEVVDKAVENSVKAHMEADVEVGCFLSGGVDSGLIASEFTGQRAYTVGFGEEGGYYHEGSLAGGTAKQCGLTHRSRRIREREFWDAVPEVLYYLDEPLGDASAVALYFLAMEAAKDVKVVVSGEGADELFGGYGIYCEPEALRLYQKLPDRFRRWLGKAAGYMPNRKGKNFLIRGSKTLEERYIGNANIFSYEERRELLRRPGGAMSPQRFLEEDYAGMGGGELTDADRMQEIDLRHWLPGDILQKADRMSMAHSLEVRVPFLDTEVFTVAKRLPHEMKQRGKVTKYIFRKAAACHIDLNTSERKKLGFPVPIRRWMCEEEGIAHLKKAFSSEAAEKYFHTEKLLELLEEHKKGRADNSRKLWTVYVFCIWYGIFFMEELMDAHNTLPVSSR
ncbi:MAG: asparagine synthase (glutamine-hydrolyzing) [Clostridiales bacterium]|nr:asparagine synthase (glutamine-hydrolyzing) [Clostridiales bacterium]